MQQRTRCPAGRRAAPGRSLAGAPGRRQRGEPEPGSGAPRDDVLAGRGGSRCGARGGADAQPRLTAGWWPRPRPHRWRAWAAPVTGGPGRSCGGSRTCSCPGIWLRERTTFGSAALRAQTRSLVRSGWWRARAAKSGPDPRPLPGRGKGMLEWEGHGETGPVAGGCPKTHSPVSVWDADGPRPVSTVASRAMRAFAQAAPRRDASGRVSGPEDRGEMPSRTARIDLRIARGTVVWYYAPTNRGDVNGSGRQRQPADAGHHGASG